jgi:hypothetical protein
LRINIKLSNPAFSKEDKMKTTIKILLLLTLCTMLFLRCAKDSPLSDVALDDPGLLKPDIQLVRSISETGAKSQEVSARLYDKNNNTIELKEGGVSVNGVEMGTVPYYLGSSANYYSTSSIDILPDSLYTVTITLANSTDYESTVRTPATELDTLEVPAQHVKTSDLTISWKEPDSSITLKVTMNYFYRNDSATGNANRFLGNVNSGAGSFTINYSHFNFRDDLTKATFELEGKVTGTINASFQSGSKITYEMSIRKTCALVDSLSSS